MNGKTWILSLLRRGLAGITALSAAASLALPAFSMEGEAPCPLQEHHHEDTCFSVSERLACSPQCHSHEDGCFRDGNLICGFSDRLIHTHTDLCRDPSGALWCPLAETTHHSHGESCFLPGEATEETTGETTAETLPEPTGPVLICPIEETLLHIHEETCFSDGTWVCQILQLEEHIHGPDCFETEALLTCTLEEHTHGETCFPETTQPTAELPQSTTEPPQTTEESLPPVTEETMDTVVPQTQSYSADPAEGDRTAVTGEGIRFRLFDYSEHINKDASLAAWRPISAYFTFRNSHEETGDVPSDTVLIPSHNINAAHDADGFTASHATVERNLVNGLPVLDLSRNADGTARTDPNLNPETRSLAYLFSDTGDHGVTVYQPRNTILQKDGTRYWYDSRSNAVDYDIPSARFHIREYAERNSTTAGYGSTFGDFLPFNYTGGAAIGETEDDATPYHLDTRDVNYWFGMSMEVSFSQSKNGLVGDENMVFHFSGDDDVWVFVDGVLVLDLGGTHGTVDGSIDFATGQVLQYLSWNGANTTEEARTKGSSTSFPTTLRACFDAAGKTPAGGWNETGSTFADYTQHTLTFFYLERGAAVANCRIDFRLPTLPDKSLTVTKELTAEGETENFLRESLTYRFRVMKADSSGNATQELYIKPGMTYTLLENAVAVGSGTVAQDGTFALKAGQSAQFTDMLYKGGGAVNYVVQEIMPQELTGQYSGVEYTVSGDGGETKTEEGEEEGFTAFVTPSLSAEQTQMVTFRNRVDTARLCRLKITKEKAEGASFPENTRFPILVKLGGILPEAGTAYRVGEEIRTMAQPGQLQLAVGETAELLQGILSGTEFEVTETETEGLHYRPSYSGTITPEGSLNCTANGASGTFPLDSTAEITVTNASYDYSLEIPISKQALDNVGKETFFFRLSRVEPQPEGGWLETEELPGASVTVTDNQICSGRFLIGFRADAQGDFYYKAEEMQGSGNFLYDDTFYILRVTAGSGTATVTQLLKNGTQELQPDTCLAFVNRRTASLLITKTVIGGDREEPFHFTAAVNAGGEQTVTEFTLKHGQQFLLENLPWGAEITVSEAEHAHYLPSYRIEGIHTEQVHRSTASLTANQDTIVLSFTNRCGYELPKTGGSGTNLYTLGGLLQMASAVCLLYYQRKREKGDPGSY